MIETAYDNISWVNDATDRPKGGSKMDRARLQGAQEIVIKASDYAKDHHGKVVCAHCRCPVTGVSRYSPNVRDEQVIIAAHFRLAANIDHNWTCRYNIEKTMTRWVANSKSI